MPFDKKKWNQLATQGDVAGIAINTTVALYAVQRALRNLQDGQSPEDALQEITKSIDSLDRIFTELTGYTSDGE